MQISKFPILYALILPLLCQCGSHSDKDGYGQEYPLYPESYASIDSCMAFMDSNPARAHHMLDSVRDAGIMSPQRCHYLHAMVVFEGDHQPDSALMMCNYLLDEGDFGDDHLLEAEICELATNITFGCNRYIELLRYAHRGIALCHGREQLRSDEASMMGRAGVAHQRLGHIEEAREAFRKALGLVQADTSFGGLIAFLSLQKKQLGLYREVGDYDQVIAGCHEILDQVERFDRDPSFVDPRPATMNESGEATHGFADFYQTQMYTYIAGAYRMKVEQGVSVRPEADRDSAAAYVEKWTHTEGSLAPRNKLLALRELYFTGHRAEFDAAKQAAGESLGKDTLVLDYIDYLRLLAEEAASRKDIEASSDYLQRAVSVNDSIRQHELLRSFTEQMSIHKVQEAQLAQLDAENRLSRTWILTISLGVILLTCIVINILMRINRRRKHALVSMQQNLNETKDVVHVLEQQLEVAKAERPIDNMKVLYQRIEQVMNEKQLYLIPNLDVRMLAEEVNSSRTSISQSINNVSGKTFRNWLSAYRLDLFLQMLEEYPDESIEEVMTRCGYQEQSTLRRQFKSKYGMTASEYRKRLLKRDKE